MSRTQVAFENLSAKELDEMCHNEEASVDECTAKVMHSSSDHETTVKVIDDSGDASPYHNTQWILFGHEYGPTHLIRSWGESTAHEIWIDEQPTIENSEIPEAYNAFDKLVAWLEERGHESTSTLRHFANRWASLFFDISVRNSGEDDTFWDNWPLDEAYQQQSNATGCGIVNVGHHEWYETLNASSYTAKFSGTMS